MTATVSPQVGQYKFVITIGSAENDGRARQNRFAEVRYGVRAR